MNPDWLVHTKIDVQNFKNIVDSVVRDNNIKRSVLDTKSTKGFLSEQYELDDYADQLSEIKDVIIQTTLSKLFEGHQLNLLSAWTVYGKESGYHKLHRHAEVLNHVATVLYLDVPQETNVNQNGEFYYVYRDEMGQIQKGGVVPEEGSLIVMPCYLFHGTYPQAKGNRQTLSMDFEVV